MGAAAPAVAAQTAREPGPRPASTLIAQSSETLDEVRLAVLNALASAGQTMLCSMLETGDWNIRGNELIIRIPASATLIEMSASAEMKRMIIATASGKLGRAVKLEILPGASAASVSAKPAMNYSDAGTRSRAEQDPVVQRLKEKFGAQIRTVIEYKGKK